jgi:hypothetical protein
MFNDQHLIILLNLKKAKAQVWINFKLFLFVCLVLIQQEIQTWYAQKKVKVNNESRRRGKKESSESLQLHKNTCRYLRWKENDKKICV